MNNDLISKSTTIKMLREYADQKCVRGEIELANGILKAVCYIENGNIPAANSDDGWIYCGDGKNLPEEYESIFAKLKGTDKWDDAMFEKSSNTVNVTVEDKNGKRITMVAHTNDGKWKIDSCAKLKVIAWQPFPDPCCMELGSHSR